MAEKQEKVEGKVVELLPPAVIGEAPPVRAKEDARIQPLVDMFEQNRLQNQAWADSLVVTTQEELEDATEKIALIKKSKKVIESTRLWVVEDLTKWIAEKNGVFNPIKNGLDAIEKQAKKICQAFLDEQERERQKEQARLDAEAEKKRKLHATLATKAVAEAQEAESEEDSASLMAKAQEQLEKAHAVDTQVAAPKAEAAAGSHSTGRWTGEITDKKKFVEGLAKGIIPWDPDLIQVPKGLLNEKARALKNTVAWPGVRFYQDKSLTVKTAD